MQIHMSGQQFIFPAQCACCGATPQTTIYVTASKSTGKRVVHTTSKSWGFPYCLACANHVRSVDGAVTALVLLLIGTVILTACLYFLASATNASIIIGVIGMAGSVFLYNSLMAKAKSMCGSDCACVSHAVAYSGWQGTCHMFEVISQSYAFAFMIANQRKLVNVDPEVWQWLQANGYAQQSSPTQSPRRYMS